MGEVESGEGKLHPAANRDANMALGAPISQADHDLVAKYRKGVAKGMLKVMAKMGISTLQSYKGAQIFEAIGLRDSVIDRCFTGTAAAFRAAISSRSPPRRSVVTRSVIPSKIRSSCPCCPIHGEFHWRAEGERHMWDPTSIADIQVAARGAIRAPTSDSLITSTKTRKRGASCAVCLSSSPA